MADIVSSIDHPVVSALRAVMGRLLLLALALLAGIAVPLGAVQSQIPTVTSLSPANGPTGGGTLVTITGTDLSGATNVMFGETSAFNFSQDSATQITATAPAGVSGRIVNVTVTTLGGGTSAPNANSTYTYNLVPMVTSLSPIKGSAVGGTNVTIVGINLSGATAVNFGTTAASNVQQITATAPAGNGTVDVRVTTAGGTSATSAADQFTYIPIPIITGLTPDRGPIAGGTVVTITGSGLSGATNVRFGTTDVDFTPISDTQLTTTAPSGTAKTPVGVIVTTASGTSAPTNYTYAAHPTAPVVSNPGNGEKIGTTTPTYTGTRPAGATIAVTFGGAAATGITVVNDTTITAASPAHATGPVDVVVTTPGGASPRRRTPSPIPWC